MRNRDDTCYLTAVGPQRRLGQLEATPAEQRQWRSPDLAVAHHRLICFAYRRHQIGRQQVLNIEAVDLILSYPGQPHTGSIGDDVSSICVTCKNWLRTGINDGAQQRALSAFCRSGGVQGSEIGEDTDELRLALF